MARKMTDVEKAEKALADYKVKVATVATTYGEQHGYQHQVVRLLDDLGLKPVQPKRFTVTIQATRQVTMDAGSAAEARRRIADIHPYVEPNMYYGSFHPIFHDQDRANVTITDVVEVAEEG